jgi:aerobic-type carbon monoxide dehydrogenase small subunit (CoxS/CutS family)
MMKLRINGEYHEVDANPEAPLLHILREHLNLKGTANGCTPEECHGACTVLINGKARQSCKIPVGSINGDRIRTIEGIAEDHPVIKAWKLENVQECDHCKSAQVLKAISLLTRMLNPAPDDIRDALNTDQCQCGENPNIIRAVNKASKSSYDS